MAKYTEWLKDKKIEEATKKYQQMYSGELTLALARLLQQKDFRLFLSDLIGFTKPFDSAFEEKGNLSSFNMGKQAVGLKIFNDMMAVDPQSFMAMMKEEKARTEFRDKIIEEALDDNSK